MSIGSTFLDGAAPEINKISAYQRAVAEISARVEEMNDFISNIQENLYGEEWSTRDDALNCLRIEEDKEKNKVRVSLMRNLTEVEKRDFADIDPAEEDPRKQPVVPLVDLDIKINDEMVGSNNEVISARNTTAEWAHLGTRILMGEGVRINKASRPNAYTAMNQLEEVVSSIIAENAKREGKYEEMVDMVVRWENEKLKSTLNEIASAQGKGLPNNKLLEPSFAKK